MVKPFAIAFLIVASLIASRPVVADPIEYLDEDEYDIGMELGEADFYEEIQWQGIDLGNLDAPKPPPVECLRVCETVENAAQFACDFLGTPGRRGGCRVGVAAAGAVCRWVCTR
jgi:hypothetical protein